MAMVVTTLSLAGGAAWLGRRLNRLSDRLVRPAAICAGGMLGVSMALPAAMALNPFVGLQAGTFHNLMILALCFGFLGFVVGSLSGLAVGGMIHATPSRIHGKTEASVIDDEHRRATPRSGLANASEKPRTVADAPPSAPFGAILAQCQQSHDSKTSGGEE